MEFLQPLDSLEFPPIERAILNMLKGVFEYPAPLESRASKIASDILFCCTEKDSDTHVSFALLSTWDVLLELVSCVLPDHEWHQCLVQALALIREREGSANEEDPSYKWSDLPQLSIRVREHWELKPTEGDEAAPNRLENWKNVTAFISKLVSSGYTKLIYLAMWEIYDALESPPTKVKALINCRVWAVTEWILQCSQLLMKEMKSPKGQIEESEKASEVAGPLFGKDLPSRSLQRWDFWKKTSHRTFERV
ncbi:hypothetical protein S7711_11200 [Stachybotrys chartarum IBT 7711]|uniref:Uncharacterized protein n=1 Tax=Stachybotrys chartarum (strain CBS 109288 / IBT 7711) TaxID=1280523 RepID=A0A084B5W1_STACB|nr:hypothetical protein S7711_11200 [Stachybotrys chartarum IBT 7711]KFA47960.1 hypothetical protein S40293_11343 [Stachybotrys chartarum IBT 40293]